MNTSTTIQDTWFWIFVLSLAALICNFGMFYFIRRARLVEDTPTSKIRSAAQGYTELSGHCGTAPRSVVSPLTGVECTWYRYRIEKRYSSGKNTHWKQVSQGESEQPIILDDGTGQVLLNPDNAEITPAVKQRWYGEHAWPDSKKIQQRHGLSTFFISHDYRYTEQRFHQGDRLYALGKFISIGTDKQSADIQTNLNEKLHKWKQKPEAMLRHFDTSQDGIIDLQEWENVREAARKLVLRERLNNATTQVVHTLARPEDGRPFIISSKSQHEMNRRYRIQAFACLMGFVLSGPYAAWLILKNI